MPKPWITRRDKLERESIQESSLVFQSNEQFEAGIRKMIVNNGWSVDDERLVGILADYILGYSKVSARNLKSGRTELKYNSQEAASIIAARVRTQAEMQAYREASEAETQAHLEASKVSIQIHQEISGVVSEISEDVIKRELEEQAEQKKITEQLEQKRKEEEKKKAEEEKKRLATEANAKKKAEADAKLAKEKEQKRNESPYKALIEKTNEPIILWDFTKQKVALTFDDGNECVEEILDLLKSKGIKSTFFITGPNIEKKADLRKRALDEGHQVCNHTVNHLYISHEPFAKNPKVLEAEIVEREALFKKYFWEAQLVRMKKEYPFFRFPGGGEGKWGEPEKKELLGILKKHWYLPVNWTYDDPAVPKKNGEVPPDVPVNEGNKLANGAIVLLHFNEEGLKNAKRCIIGTEGTIWEKWPNPRNLWLGSEKGQQKAVTLSELIDTKGEPYGRSNIKSIPGREQFSYPKIDSTVQVWQKNN